MASAVLFCAKQCIALRGDAEQLDTPGNPGNFLAQSTKLLAVNDPHPPLNSISTLCHCTCEYNYILGFMYKVVFCAIQYDSALDQKHCVYGAGGMIRRSIYNALGSLIPSQYIDRCAVQ